MSVLKRLLAVALAALAISGQCASAHSILIDFEHVPGPDGVLGTADDVSSGYDYIQPLGEMYSALGLHFSQGSLFNTGYFTVDGSSHFISSTSPIGSFDMPVYGISIESNSYWNVTLTGHDAQGAVLVAQTLQSHGGFTRGIVSISSASAIASFSVLADKPGYILNLDNLRLEVSPVPEPSSAAMLAAGGLLLLGRRRLMRQQKLFA